MAKKTNAKKATELVVKPAAKPVNKTPAKAKAPSKKTAQAVVPKQPEKKAQKVQEATSAKVVVKAPAKAAPRPPASKTPPSKKEVSNTSRPSRSKPKQPQAVSGRVLAQQFLKKPIANKNLNLTPFLTRQRQRLLELKDTLLDSMTGVARGNLHAGSETSAFGMHQADAGSDAYDRDFALSMLSKEQGALYEIDEALKRIEDGTYGVCEICEKPIRHDRLEALPFTRFTVECQAELEKRQHHHHVRPHINSLFGLTEEEAENEEEETAEPV